MKILIFSFFLTKNNPSGLATGKIVSELARRGHEINVITAKRSDIDFPNNVVIHVCNPQPLSPARIWRILGNAFKIELNYIFWEWRAKRYSAKLIRKIKPQVLYGRGSPISSLSVPAFLKKKFNIPYVAHFADPIPAPKEWVSNELEKDKLIRAIQPVLKYSDYIGFVTDEMQIYQELTSKVCLKEKSFFSPNTITPISQSKDIGRSHEKIVLFMGSFLGLRTPELLLKGFEIFAETNPEYELHFYGSNHDLVRKFMSSTKVGDKVKLFPFSTDPYLIMKQATILVDVDANVEEQVFLSSKFIDYLTVNRFLLTISTSNSPSSKLVKHMPNTARFSCHNAGNIAECLSNLAQKTLNLEIFEERKKVLKEYSTLNVVDVIEGKFNSLIDNHVE